MGHQKTEPNTTKVALYIPDHILERVDAHEMSMRKKNEGVKVTRSDAIRSLIDRGLRDVARSR